MKDTLKRLLEKKIADELLQLLQQNFVRRRLVSVPRYNEIRIGFAPRREDYAQDEFVTIYLNSMFGIGINISYRNFQEGVASGIDRVMNKFCTNIGFERSPSSRYIEYELRDESILLAYFKNDLDISVELF